MHGGAGTSKSASKNQKFYDAMKFSPWFSSVALILLLNAQAIEGELYGTVIDVHDGDSIRLATPQGRVKVRLLHIDAPELEQANGIESRENLRALSWDKVAAVTTHGCDMYGITLGIVRCDDRKRLSAASCECYKIIKRMNDNAYSDG
jgi:endonuclease YncB( thermonuclease family)